MSGQIRLVRNLHTNPELGTGSTLWSGNLGTFSRTNEDAPTGTTWSAKLVSTGAAGNALYAGYIAATPGLSYAVAARAKVPAGIAYRWYLQFWNVGVLLSTQFVDHTGTGAWENVELSGTAPASTTRMLATLQLPVAHAASTVARLGAADYREGTYEGEYLSGTQPGGTWEGTAHASTSVRILSLGDPVAGELLVTVTEAGKDAPKRLPINGIVRSERIGSGARGEASCEFDTETLRRHGLLDCEGFWLFHEHGDLGTWGGVIRQVRHDLASGTTEVAAQTFESLLDAKRTAKEYHVNDGDAGGIAKKVITDAGRSGAAFIEGYRVAPTVLVDADLRAEQVIDAVDQLAGLADAEWRITAERWFEFGPRLGVDRSTVVLWEGRDVGAGSEVIRDITPRINDLAAMSAVSEYTRRTAVVVLDDDSIEEIGQRQGTITYPYLVKESALRFAARKELQRLQRLGRAATIEVLNTNRAWSAFSVGDTVRLLIPSCGVDSYLRVMARTWESDSDRVVITGEIGAVLP